MIPTCYGIQAHNSHVPCTTHTIHPLHICIYMHITDQIIYLFLKIFVFVIRFFFVYCILVSGLFRRVTDIQIFLVQIKTDNESNQNL